MPETKNYVFGHTELAEILIRNLDLHEGLWAIYFELGLGGGMVPTTPDGKTVTPAAITFLQKVGIQKFDSPNNLTVDAAQLNPQKTTIGKKKKTSTTDAK